MLTDEYSEDLATMHIAPQIDAGEKLDLMPLMRAVEASAAAAERERIADLWAGCMTEAEGHGRVDIGASIRAGLLIDDA